MECSWLFLPEKLLVKDGRTFSRKEGSRPVLLIRVAGPNCQVVPRSASVREGILHPAHRECISTCKLNAEGFVKAQLRYPIRTCDIEASFFSCIEPEDSRLLREMGRT